MTCSDFVSSFTEYYDGVASAALRREVEAHLERCPACRRYRDVVERGCALLRTMASPKLREDFGPRLQHRLYHVDEEAALRRHTTSGTTALAVVGMSVLLTALAWSPVLRPGVPVVEMRPIVVSVPPPPTSFLAGEAFPRPAMRAASAASAQEGGLWEDPPGLLYRHSRLSRRYLQGAALQQVGFEEER